MIREVALDTPRGRLSALRQGPADGPRVLALHGWLDNAASFLPMAPYLQGFDLVALDLPGHGHSFHRPFGADYALADHLLEVDAALDALGWAQCRLLGHSLGGALASLYAVAAPERVQKLALIEALGPLPSEPGKAVERLRASLVDRRAAADKRLRVFPDLMAAVRARMLANDLSEPVARRLVERSIAPVEGGFVWRSDPRLRHAAAYRADEASIREWIAAIECPTLVIAGDRAQPYFDQARRRGRLACLRQGRECVLPGGHHLHMETPEPVAAVLREFLASP